MRFLRSAGRLHLESMNFANAIVLSPPIGSQIRLINVVAGETALPGWGERTRTRKCRFFEISAELLAFPEHFGTRDFSREARSPSTRGTADSRKLLALRLRDVAMNIELWIGILGVLIGVVGICLAYFFYIKTIRTKVLAIA
jgi:hypothetical protein